MTLVNNARHNVYAYVLSGAPVMRYSDDGEPQGTGGIPVLETINKSGVTDVCVVVTRYFGGILLGAGGLVRVYGASARDAVEAAEIVTYLHYTECTLTCSYSDYQKIIPLFDSFEVKTDNTDFSECVTMRLAVKSDIFESFKTKISEMSGGRIDALKIGERFSY